MCYSGCPLILCPDQLLITVKERYYTAMIAMQMKHYTYSIMMFKMRYEIEN